MDSFRKAAAVTLLATAMLTPLAPARADDNSGASAGEEIKAGFHQIGESIKSTAKTVWSKGKSAVVSGVKKLDTPDKPEAKKGSKSSGEQRDER